MEHHSAYDVTERADGGLDVTLHLGPAEARAVNSEELHVLADGLHSVLQALEMLRREPVADPASVRAPAPEDWYWALLAIYRHLGGRLEGIGDAAVRAHAAAGGSIGQLAAAMNVARSTAQYRREVILSSQRSGWEAWATGDLGGRQEK